MTYKSDFGAELILFSLPIKQATSSGIDARLAKPDRGLPTSPNPFRLLHGPKASGYLNLGGSPREQRGTREHLVPPI